MNEWPLEITDSIDKSDEKVIFAGLLEYNLAHLENKEPRRLGVFLRGDDGAPQAGLIGETHGNWLFVKYLWVSEEKRGQGLGSRILKSAEDEARTRGCRFVFLDTFGFQAPQFYEKYGYNEGFRLTEYPEAGTRHYYTKSL